MLKVIRYHIIFIDKPKNKRRIEMETLVPIKEERIKVNDISNDFGLESKPPRIYKKGAIMHADYDFKQEREIESSTVGDVIKFGLRIMNSYNGSFQLSYLLVAFRLVCSNGLVIPKTFRTLSVKHTKGNSDKFNTSYLKNRLGKALSDIDVITNNYNKWAKTEVKEAEAFDFFNKSFGRRSSKKLFEYYLQNKEEDTIWGLYNSLTKYITHDLKPRKNNEDNLGLSKHIKGIKVVNRITNYFEGV
jgi:hypothetical protein